MARTEVSSMIRDILDAFSNGLKIIKGSGKRHKNRAPEGSKAIDHDRRVRESLTERPHEIKQAYDEAVTRYGGRFETGDSTSQNGLAQILLRLNTGLIKLLNQALSPDKVSRSRSRTGLFTLSEAAAIDTLSAMSELSVRLLSTSRIDLNLPLPAKNESRHHRKSSRTGQNGPQESKRTPPTPLLEHGGWVRSKTSPSVVSVVVAPRPRRVDPKRSSRSRSQSATELGKAAAQVERSPPPRYTQLEDDQGPTVKAKPYHLRSQSASTALPQATKTPDLVRHPSMYLVTSDFLQSIPQHAMNQDAYHSGDVLPIQPTKEFRRCVDEPRFQEWPSTQRLPIRPISMMTFMTASTKIGEIPEHRLPDRVLTQEQEESVPMPYVVPEMLEPKKRNGRGLKFWKKDRSALTSPQYAVA